MMEAGQMFMVDEDGDLLLADVSGQGDGYAVSGQDGKESGRIDLGDPSLFPTLNGGRARSFPPCAERRR